MHAAGRCKGVRLTPMHCNGHTRSNHDQGQMQAKLHTGCNKATGRVLLTIAKQVRCILHSWHIHAKADHSYMKGQRGSQGQAHTGSLHLSRSEEHAQPQLILVFIADWSVDNRKGERPTAMFMVELVFRPHVCQGRCSLQKDRTNYFRNCRQASTYKGPCLVVVAIQQSCILPQPVQVALLIQKSGMCPYAL